MEAYFHKSLVIIICEMETKGRVFQSNVLGFIEWNLEKAKPVRDSYFCCHQLFPRFFETILFAASDSSTADDDSMVEIAQRIVKNELNHLRFEFLNFDLLNECLIDSIAKHHDNKGLALVKLIICS